MEINGLPAHPLLVHVVVVLLPLAAIGGILVSLWPAAQRKLTFLVPLAAVVGTAVVPLTTKAGHALEDTLGQTTPAIDTHAGYGEKVIWFAVVFAVATVVQWWLLRGKGPSAAVRWIVAAVVVVSAVGVLTIVVLTGDSGARAVWG
ncbi:conserved membrane hypothetical protein [Nostocoides japonicum T1-X7]|uniref:DUF2231 domain-containing protein n=1 Tax=Nostocoides japonicum T1-X7 TaxID=1194083 RepID=A0A077LT63_9MICO|nr:DUF2231 domain-containing protein [Tetrasphaera japonica]CCH76201.1 conserved membrane hypothetical protein [Tetrasphaera japonica T1-X7]